MTPDFLSAAFGELAALRERPIPDQAPLRAAREGFRNRRIDKAGAAYGEKLVSAKAHGVAGENYYFITRNPPYWRRIDGSNPDLLMREGVAARLKSLNARLAKSRLELFLFDAWRPRDVQAYFHDVWMPAELKKRSPLLAGEALRREVERYWAAPTASEDSPAPHSTGAALDLTLRWIGGEQLWMGSLFDDVTEIAHRDRFERAEDSISFSDEEARANRRLLHWVMSEAGFVGHPDEWWHFSHGDQLWSALTGAPAAIYGLAQRD